MPPAATIRALINTPDGLLPLTAERARTPLPGGPDGNTAPLAYGPYLHAIVQFLGRDSHQALLAALSQHLRRPVPPSSIGDIELISEKHGALYHVARLRVHLAHETCSFAVNVAVRPEQQAFVENEYDLLRQLNGSYPSGCLPAPYLKGDTICHDDQNGPLPLKILIAEWFEDYHEFHLSSEAEAASPVVRVWNSGPGGSVLDREQAFGLYRRAAAILTAYLDGASFQQIYPWHHAAGDFVLKLQGQDVDLRLITVRDYRCLLPPGPDHEDLWMAVVHFFLNLSLRLRIDRLDGTGELAWAAPDCLPGILAGFLQSWQHKTAQHRHLPSIDEVLSVLRSFSPAEWLPLVELVMADGVVEADEVEFLGPRLADHVAALSRVLQEGPAAALSSSSGT